MTILFIEILFRYWIGRNENTQNRHLTKLNHPSRGVFLPQVYFKGIIKYQASYVCKMVFPRPVENWIENHSSSERKLEKLLKTLKFSVDATKKRNAFLIVKVTELST